MAVPTSTGPAVSVRAVGRDAMHLAMAPIFHYFGGGPTAEMAQSFGELMGDGRAHVAFDGDDAVGGAGAHSFKLTVPGGHIDAAGVSIVGVLPTHRRRGVLRNLMRAQLDSIHDRGEAVAYLWASEATIYGRFGYGLASFTADISVARERTAYARQVPAAGTCRFVDHDTAAKVMPEIYERVVETTPGMFARSRHWWESRVLADDERHRAGAGELQRVLCTINGEPEAYALYRIRSGFEHFISTACVDIIEAMGTTPAATAAIWRFLLDIDWVARVDAHRLPVDHPLLLLTAEPRRLDFRLSDALWLRLVDVQAALSARTYRGDGQIVFEVSDEFCPWNAGTWEVSQRGVRRSDADAQIRLDVSALASVYLGGVTFAELARALRLDELRPGAVTAADDLFRTDHAPWCPEIF